MDARSHRPRSKFKAKLLTRFAANDATSGFKSRFVTKTEATERVSSEGGGEVREHENYKLRAVYETARP